MKKQDERASCLEKSERLDAVARHPHTACACENEEERSSSIVLVVGVQREGERERERDWDELHFSLIESVALAGQCCHRPARFRHRNVYSIRVDHLPLGKL